MSWMPQTRIPTELLAPLVQEYLRNHACENEIGVARLAEEAGLGYEQIRRLSVPGQKGTTFSFDDADRLVAAMDCPELWLHEPLFSIYQGINLTYIDQKYPIVVDNVRRLAAA